LAVQRKTLTAAPSIRKLPEQNVRRVFYEAGEFEQVLDTAPAHLQDVLRFFHATGWRKSEVTGLTWAMVDLPAGVITLPHSKNGRGRVLAIADVLVEVMKRREAARLVETPDGVIKVVDHVFHKDGRPLRDFRGAWHATLERAGLSHLETQPDGTTRRVYDRTVHDFRRTCARNLIRSGVSQTVAMEVTGHRTDSMFRRYDITSTEDTRLALEKSSTGSVPNSA
jgi:integrase